PKPPNQQDMDDVEGRDAAVAAPDAGERDAAPGPSCGVCDDGIACTIDFCEEGACQYVAEDDLCAAGERCDRVRGCVPRRCRSHADCDDENACTGVERCDPSAAAADPATGCVAGTPLDCDDKIAC